MTDFRPLRAWRYNPEKVQLADVMAPPYDVISEEKQKHLYRSSPFNCIRLILNQPEPADHPGSNVYTRARDFLKTWQAEKIMIQEASEAFYLYRQEFDDPADGRRKTRSALFGRIKLEPFEKGIVIPHEKTLSKPKEDRRKLLEMTETNLSPVFGLVEDRERRLQKCYEKFYSQKPLYEAKDDEHVLHQLWKIEDAAAVQSLTGMIAAKKVYIADGHHRYQTALDHSRRVREALGNPSGELLSDFVLMALVEFHDPGLALMPTHRIVLPFAGFSPDSALDALKTHFEVTTMNSKELSAALEREPFLSDQPSLGLLFPRTQKTFLLRLRDLKKAKAAMAMDKPDLWCKLDVALVSYLVLAKLWNVPQNEWEKLIRYSHHEKDALVIAEKNQAAAVFFTKRPAVEILRDMGELNELMPQKSTYFYPKLASGLVLYSHQEGAE